MLSLICVIGLRYGLGSDTYAVGTPTVTLTEVSSTNVNWSGWKLYGGATISDGILRIAGAGQYAEKYFLVDGNSWVALLNAMSENAGATNKGLNVITEFYDSNFQLVQAKLGSNTATKTITISNSSYTNYEATIANAYGSNVKYMKLKLSWGSSSESPIRISGMRFTTNYQIGETYTGMRIEASAVTGEIESIRYLWSHDSTGVTTSQLTNTAVNGEVVYPRYGAQGTYYLWTLVTDTESQTNFSRSDAVTIDNLEINLSRGSDSWRGTVKVKTVMFNQENIFQYESDIKGTTKGSTSKDDPYVSGPVATVTSIPSQFIGSTGWLLEKTGTNYQWHGHQKKNAVWNGIPAGTCILVSSHYNSTNGAGVINFVRNGMANHTTSPWVVYDTTSLSSNIRIVADGTWRETYDLIVLNEDTEPIDKNVLISGLPNWTYSNQEGRMMIDGIQWFVFDSEADIDNGIVEKKWAKGEKTVDYFWNNGNAVNTTDDSFIATENGIYTVYARTINGSEMVKMTEVNTIDSAPPSLQVDLSGYQEGSTTKDRVCAVVTGEDSQSGVQKIEYSVSNINPSHLEEDVAAATWTSILPASNETATNNLLPNGDFSKIQTSSHGWNRALNGNYDITYWRTYNGSVESPSAGYHAHLDRQRFGSNVLAFVNQNSLIGKQGRSLSASTSIEKVLERNQNYTLSFDMYAENAGVQVKAGIYNASGDLTSNQMTFTASDSEVGHWVRRTFTFTTTNTADTTNKSQLAFFGNSGEEGTFYIKNVKLQTGVSATNWTALLAEQLLNSKKGYFEWNHTYEKTIWFKVTDFAGNYAVESHHISIDQLEPSITSVRMNDGASATKNLDVIVEINADEADYMYISDTSTAPTNEQWIPYRKYSKFRLSPGNASKTIYVWCKDLVGNVSERVSGSIALNATYSMKVKSNQTYSGTGEYVVYYAKKEEGGSYSPWQLSDTFSDLLPGTVYFVKTKIEGNDMARESEEYRFCYVYDENQRLVLEEP